ncbi:conserved hypothetical protein [Rhodopseudomonas palustris HaA2]|uniref:DUF2927 domain-containing protein n=1 Tax=Rhodopseudomonas palustris (strain HaA2) TaxID=316058 RepID=Q2IT35_RHOP2|nr:DUF2927 domain-containing protein [Rhodopseudomonas palustris]ABD08625.1 conserved hypothetical protein [Rhodopseudomonas palustris HaA2]
MQRGPRPRPVRRALAAIVAAVLTSSAAASSSAAEPTDIAADQRAEKTDFSDSQILDGFFKTAFGAEYHVAGRVDRIRKFEGPVRIHAEGESRPDRRAQLARVVADIARRVRHLDIAMTDDGDEANVTVHLVRDKNLGKTIASFYGAERAREIHQSLDPQCLSGFRKNDRYEIEQANVILTVDNGDFVFLDCAYEELLQSLGPINDTDAVPWTMFNDGVQKGYFDVYDQYLMNILYHPEIKPGMTVQEVKAVLPQVMRDVRGWVARVNGTGP